MRLILAMWLVATIAGPAEAQGPEREYRVLVASEGNDRIAVVRFGPGGAEVVRERKIGTNPTELAGPHGIAVSPDGRWYYVSTAHGTPNGALWKFSAQTDEQLGRVELGLFPATVQLSPDGLYAWVVNFNLYGEHVPSSVSVVYTDGMVEVRRITTCVMPHGSRLSTDGKRHYSVCMMDDILIEIDAATMAVSRHFMLGKGSEHGMAGAPGMSAAAHAGAHGMDHGAPTCSPTWAQPMPDGASVWVACNASNDLVEVDAADWRLRRRIPAGEGVYNLAVTNDGAILIATNKRAQSVSLFDAAAGTELARIATSRRVPSGVVISSDDRYAFVTLEGVGAEPGSVDIIDLRTRTRVTSVDVGQQAGGIDVLRISPAGAASADPGSARTRDPS